MNAAPETERSLLWRKFAVILAAIVPGAFFSGVARLGYVDAVKAAHSRLDELARTAEEHAARVLERNGLVTQQMLRLVKDDDDVTLPHLPPPRPVRCEAAVRAGSSLG